MKQSLGLQGHGMSTGGNSRITLEIEAGEDPIRGLIEQPDGTRQPFWGWLELIEELRRVATRKVESPTRPTEAGPGPPPEPDAASETTATTTQSCS